MLTVEAQPDWYSEGGARPGAAGKAPAVDDKVTSG